MQRLYAKWIFQMSTPHKICDDLVFCGFKAAGMTETAKETNEFRHRVENPPNI